MRQASRASLAFAVVFAGLAAAAYGQLTIANSVPTNGPVPVAPLFIASGSDGALWFTQPDASSISRMTTGGSFTAFSIPSLNSHPAGIAAGPDGALWFIEAASSKIGRLTTAGAFTEYPFASGGNNVNDGITAGPDGALWFTEFGDNRVGRITTSGAVTTFNVPTAGSGPSGITTGQDGALWFVQTNGNNVGRVTTGGAFSEFPIPTPDSQPVGITAGADGALWFTESNGSKIGRITTSGVITEFGAQSGNLSQIVAAPDGTLWFTDRTGSIGRITTSGTVSEFATVAASPVGITVGSDGNLWYADQGDDSIDAVVFRSTLFLGGGRFAVTTVFQSTADGIPSGATAVTLTDNSGYFWFFGPTNIELVTKVLDGCAINGNYWFFAAGLTNVRVLTGVQDLQAGADQAYSNDFGTSFQPIQDTAALSTCP